MYFPKGARSIKKERKRPRPKPVRPRWGAAGPRRALTGRAASRWSAGPAGAAQLGHAGLLRLQPSGHTPARWKEPEHRQQAQAGHAQGRHLRFQKVGNEGEKSGPLSQRVGSKQVNRIRLQEATGVSVEKSRVGLRRAGRRFALAPG